MEESMIINGWATLPTIFENLDQLDSAIRQFCPARVAQEQEGEFEITWPPHFANESPQQQPHADINEIVDTFFNVECYEKDNNALNYFSQDQDEIINETFYHQYQEDGDDDLMIDPTVMIDVEELDGSDGADASIAVGVDQGLHLVHLLLACAEAVGCRDANLANSILTQIWPRVSPFGDPMQRVSHCFAMGLKSRLSLLHSINPNGSFNTNRVNLDVSLITREEKSEAFYLLHQTTPYIAFGFTAANDAIFRAANGRSSLHIVDLGMEHNLQWPSLVRQLALRKEGPPKIIRLTGIIGDDHRDTLELEYSLKGLHEEALSLGIFFEYHVVHEQVSPLSITREKLNIKEQGGGEEEEALFVNSIMHLHKHVKESRGSLKNILLSIKKLKPTLMTVVEQDANHNGPFFLGRFLESLHYYSAVFDSLEATLERSSERRRKIEGAHFAEEIRNVVAYEGGDRSERHERSDQWRRQLGRGGFQVVGLECLGEVKVVVAACGDGYTVGGEKGCLQLGWRGRPIMLASAWQVHN